MQLTDTCPLEIKDTSHLSRLLHVLLAAESEATEQYEQVIASLPSESNRKVMNEVVEALKEIKKDELNHTGILIKLIAELNPEDGQAMVEGAKENA